jgi:hypothetical protein
LAKIKGVTYVTGENVTDVVGLAEAANVPMQFVGFSGGDRLVEDVYIEGDQPKLNLPLVDLRAAHESFFPALMQGEL